MGTYSQGLYVLNNDLDILNRIHLDQNIKSIKSDKSQNKIYLGTDNGIHVFSFKNGFIKRIKLINEFDGLRKSRFTNLYIDHELLHCSKNYISLINKEYIDKKTKGIVEINKVYNSDSIYNYKKHFTIPRENNNLIIKSSINTFDNPSNFEKSYSLSHDKKNSNIKKYRNCFCMII
mgnify:CR=1 FL=1